MAVKDKVRGADELPDSVEELRALLLRERGERAAADAEAAKPRKGWRVLTPIANYSGVMHSRGHDGDWVEVKFDMGEAFVADRAVARALASDYGYFTEPAFDDIDVRPLRWVSENADGTRGQWVPFVDKDGHLPKGTGLPEGYERRVMVRVQ